MGKAQRHKGASARKKSKDNKRKAASQKTKPTPPKPATDGGAASAAVTYLEQWSLQQQQPASEPIVWKFNKTRQTFLLRAWPHREKLSSDGFKLWLPYAQSLPAALAERTVAHAREVVTSSEAAEQELLRQQEQQEQQPTNDGNGDDDDGDGASASTGAASAMTPEAREERRAVLKIQRVRALRLLKALVEPAADGGSAE